MSEPHITDTEPWASHPAVAPVAEREGERLVLRGNGSRSCAGGWQMVCRDVEPGRAYRISCEVTFDGIAYPRDQLRGILHWGEVAVTEERNLGLICDYLLPVGLASDRMRLERVVTAPAEVLTIRYVHRWQADGVSRWSLPTIEPAELPARRDVTVAVVTGKHGSWTSPATIQGNLERYLGLCRQAAETVPELDLIVLPEICLQWLVPGHPTEVAVPAPGPETEPFSDLARRHGLRICLGLLERDGDAVHNTAALISPSGEIDGRYHKVHLASGGEDVSGIVPGDSFPVHATELGRIGCNICMDSSAAESSRMVGLNGADLLLLPIMGDHRASRYSIGSPLFNASRWLAIQRTRAIDNQLTMVVARNQGEASCIIDRRGDVLAYNEGDQDHIAATIPAEDGYRMWNGGCFRDVNWLQRRPHVYAPFVDETNLGSLGRNHG